MQAIVKHSAVCKAPEPSSKNIFGRIIDYFERYDNFSL